MCPYTNNPTAGSPDKGLAYKTAFRCVMKTKQVKVETKVKAYEIHHKSPALGTQL